MQYLSYLTHLCNSFLDGIDSYPETVHVANKLFLTFESYLFYFWKLSPSYIDIHSRTGFNDPPLGQAHFGALSDIRTSGYPTTYNHTPPTTQTQLL